MENNNTIFERELNGVESIKVMVSLLIILALACIDDTDGISMWEVVRILAALVVAGVTLYHIAEWKSTPEGKEAEDGE